MTELIVVIHIRTDSSHENGTKNRTYEQVKIAFDGGAHGVFLTIGEAGLSVNTILKCYYTVRKSYPDKFIGINFMCEPELAAETIPLDCSAIWIDKGLGSIDYIHEITKVRNILDKRNYTGLYFGGFCFKGNNQKLLENPELIKEKQWNPEKYFDVCLTSGISTGISIDSYLVDIINQKTNGLPLCIASGVSINNVTSYKNKVKYLVIGTGVEIDSTDTFLIQFYKGAGLPNPVEVGSLDINKIISIVNLINK